MEHLAKVLMLWRPRDTSFRNMNKQFWNLLLLIFQLKQIEK